MVADNIGWLHVGHKHREVAMLVHSNSEELVQHRDDRNMDCDNLQQCSYHLVHHATNHLVLEIA